MPCFSLHDWVVCDCTRGHSYKREANLVLACSPCLESFREAPFVQICTWSNTLGSRRPGRPPPIWHRLLTREQLPTEIRKIVANLKYSKTIIWTIIGLMRNLLWRCHILYLVARGLYVQKPVNLRPGLT